jgi:hypothetical protein
MYPATWFLSDLYSRFLNSDDENDASANATGIEPPKSGNRNLSSDENASDGEDEQERPQTAFPPPPGLPAVPPTPAGANFDPYLAAAPRSGPMAAPPLMGPPPFPRMLTPIGPLGSPFPPPPMAVPDWRALEALGAKAQAVIEESVQAGYRALGDTLVERLYESDGKTYATYVKPKGELPWLYSGRASGVGTPEKIVARRSAAGYPSREFGDAVLDRSSKSYAAIRGREQDLVNYTRYCGNSANKINPISPFNPFALYYMMRAAEEFGGPVRPGEYPCPNPRGAPPR